MLLPPVVIKVCRSNVSKLACDQAEASVPAASCFELRKAHSCMYVQLDDHRCLVGQGQKFEPCMLRSMFAPACQGPAAFVTARIAISAHDAPAVDVGPCCHAAEV